MPYYPEQGIIHIPQERDTTAPASGTNRAAEENYLRDKVPLIPDARGCPTIFASQKDSPAHELAKIWANSKQITHPIDGLVAPAKRRPLLCAQTPNGDWKIIDQQTGTVIGTGNTRDEALHKARNGEK